MTWNWDIVMGLVVVAIGLSYLAAAKLDSWYADYCDRNAEVDEDRL